jgi:hypothetical protein
MNRLTEEKKQRKKRKKRKKRKTKNHLTLTGLLMEGSYARRGTILGSEVLLRGLKSSGKR